MQTSLESEGPEASSKGVACSDLCGLFRPRGTRMQPMRHCQGPVPPRVSSLLTRKNPTQ